MKPLFAFCAWVAAGSGLLVSLGQGSGQGGVPEDGGTRPGTLSLDEIRARLAHPQAHQPFVPEVPLGIGADLAALVPPCNPLTPAKVELGRQLYFDPRLSRDATVSCATCHDPARGWTDNLPVSVGIDDQRGGRSAPTIVNRILGRTQFWDGRAASLEDQALAPIANPIEMGFSPGEAAERLDGIAGYRLQFEAVFGGPAAPEGIARAIAAFERTILSGASQNDFFEAALPFFEYEPDEDEDPEFLARMDRILEQEKQHRMGPSAERGRGLFFAKGKCSACHSGQDLTDERFHNLGIGMDGEEPDLGRFGETGRDRDRGAFKTPTLRNVARTAPYMHDGSLGTLAEVVEHYDRGGLDNPWLSDKIVPLGLTAEEKRDLVSFLEEALTGPVTAVEVPRLP